MNAKYDIENVIVVESEQRFGEETIGITFPVVFNSAGTKYKDLKNGLIFDVEFKDSRIFWEDIKEHGFSPYRKYTLKQTPLKEYVNNCISANKPAYQDLTKKNKIVLRMLNARLDSVLQGYDINSWSAPLSAHQIKVLISTAEKIQSYYKDIAKELGNNKQEKEEQKNVDLGKEF